MRNRSRRTKQADPAAKLAKELLPEAQARRADYRLVDVANHTDADQRHMVRSGEKKTLRKMTRVERLTRAGVISPDQALACEWYAHAYELGFQTVGCTANYMGAGGGGFGATDLFARYKAQGEARANYHYARQAIPNHLLGLFEAIVLHGGDEPGRWTAISKRDKTAFSLAAFLLHGQIGHMLAIAA
jgi:hypothetical protein